MHSSIKKESGTRLPLVANELHVADPDRFLLSLFAPAGVRENVQSIFAFNAELAKIPESVSEPMLGLIRLTWWREVVDAIYTNAPHKDHPVAHALREAVNRHGLSRAHFDAILDAREQDIESHGIANLAALEQFADATSSPLLLLALECLGDESELYRQSARHYGIAWALLGMMRAIPYHAALGRMYLPHDLLQTTGITHDALLQKHGGWDDRLKPLVQQIAGHTAHHLEQGKTALAVSDIPLLHAADTILHHYLKALKSAGYNPQNAKPHATWLRLKLLFK